MHFVYTRIILFEGKGCVQIFKRELSQNESQVPQLRKGISLVEKKKGKKKGELMLVFD